MMQVVLLIACCVVALVLFRGLWNMMKGGSANRSQQLMRMRVATQAVVVVLLVGFVWYTRG